MSVRRPDPWGRSNNQLPMALRDEDRNPLLSLHREMNRLFDDVFRSFNGHPRVFGSVSSLHTGWPNIEISETDKNIKVTVEIPGLEEKDIEVLLDDGILTLRGEKYSEVEDKEKQLSECFYGHVERRILVGREIEEDKIEASFKNGILNVDLPKSAKAQSQGKRIAIKS